MTNPDLYRTIDDEQKIMKIESNRIKKDFKWYSHRILEELISPARLARQNSVLCCWLNRILNGVHISPYASIPEDITFIHGTGIVIGDGVEIGEGCTLGDNIIIGEHKEGYPKIGDNVTIYGNSMIIGGVNIGKNSIIGGCTFINKDIPENSCVFNKKELIIKKR